jgi:TRAP-type C4-dicarboxylate transport system permease small subunit
MRMKKAFETLLMAIKKIEVVLIVLMLAMIVCVVGAQVLMRYFFRPFAWAEELTAIVLIYLSFFAADVVYKEKSHISVDFFVGKLPRLFQRLIGVALYSAILIFLVMMIPRTATLVRMQSRITISAAIALPKSFHTLPVLLVFPSMVLTTLYYLIDEVEKMTGRERPAASKKTEPQEIKYL